MTATIATADASNDKPSEQAEPLPRCPCGHDRNHVMVSANQEHGFGGWVLVLIGISAPPRAVNFTCRECGTVIERTKDPKRMKEIRST